MNKKTRRLTFYLLLIIFLVLTPAIIFYALGYNFDFNKKTIVSTGAILLKSYPPKAEIYINNRPRGKTDKFVKYLIPKTYQVTLIKEDYHNWHKNLLVKPGLVTEAKNILLVPFNPKISLITESKVNSFIFFPEQKKIIYSTNNALKLIDTAKNTDKELLMWDTRYPTLEGSKLLRLGNKDNMILLNKEDKYYLFNIEKHQLADLNELIKRISNYNIFKINNLKFHPQEEKLYFLSNNNLYSLKINESNIEESGLSPILAPNILNYAIFKSGIIYLDYFSGKIYELNLITLESSKFFDQVFPSLNQSQWTLSNDTKKLLCQKENSLEILWLEGEKGNSIIREKGETEKISFSEKINQVLWYPETDTYLIVSTTDTIFVTELDGREPRNTINFITTENPQLEYNSLYQALYFLSQNRLYKTRL